MTNPSHPPPVQPGGMVGILGGGQLGRMLALAAAKLGLKAHIYSDVANAPAFAVAAAVTTAPYDDAKALEAFADACDVVTFEFENVPAATASALARRGPIYPSARALAITQDRLNEKWFLAELGLETAAFAPVNSEDAVHQACATIGTPAILKTRRLGYDGKGQSKISTPAAATAAWHALKEAPSILERYVDFQFEASIIAVRGRDGAFATYDPSENFHENHILRRSSVPSRLDAAQCRQAQAIAQKIAEALDYVGVLGVELFVRRDGHLFVNEIAPRVHNSGHWTIEACVTSQFEQHIRAVAGWPLGDARRHSDAVMENIIGDEAREWQMLAGSGASLHLYDKSEIRPHRKMGHRTWLRAKTER